MISEVESRADALADLVQPVCQARGVDLVDVRYVREPEGAVLRVMIERPGADPFEPGSGVTLAECTDVSRDLSEALDGHGDLLSGSYRLEVGSPGVERPLVRLADFERFSGRKAVLHTREAVEQRRRFSGMLAGVAGEDVLIEQDGRTWAVPCAQIKKANLKF